MEEAQTAQKVSALASIESWLSEARPDLPTPCYIYSPSAVVANYRGLKNALQTPLVMSLKACPCIELQARAAHIFRDGVEVCSIGELSRAVGLPGEIFLNTPAIDRNLMEAALSARVTIVLDNISQFRMLADLRTSYETKPVMIRLNTSAINQASKPLRQGKPADHFGFDFDGALSVLRSAACCGIEVRGIHVYRGSYSFGGNAVEAAKATSAVVQELERSRGARFETINLGGGFPDDWSVLDGVFRPYRAAARDYFSGGQVIHESGRALFSSAGYFAVSVVNTKVLNDRLYIVCDGGLPQNFLLAGTEAFVRRLSKAHFMPLGAQERLPLTAQATLVGPTCSPRDVIGFLPAGTSQPISGDVCVLPNCGAYNFAYSMPTFLSSAPARQFVLATG